MRSVRRYQLRTWVVAACHRTVPHRRVMIIVVEAARVSVSRLLVEGQEAVPIAVTVAPVHLNVHVTMIVNVIVDVMIVIVVMIVVMIVAESQTVVTGVVTIVVMTEATGDTDVRARGCET